MISVIKFLRIVLFVLLVFGLAYQFKQIVECSLEFGYSSEACQDLVGALLAITLPAMLTVGSVLLLLFFFIKKWLMKRRAGQ